MLNVFCSCLIWLTLVTRSPTEGVSLWSIFLNVRHWIIFLFSRCLKRQTLIKLTVLILCPHNSFSPIWPFQIQDEEMNCGLSELSLQSLLLTLNAFPLQHPLSVSLSPLTQITVLYNVVFLLCASGLYSHISPSTYSYERCPLLCKLRARHGGCPI